MHRIQIDKIEGIYDVHVGCQKAHFLTADALLADLKVYLADPEGTTKRYYAYIAARDSGKKECAAEVTEDRAAPLPGSGRSLRPIMEPEPDQQVTPPR